MTYFFDGKAFAENKKKELKAKVRPLLRKGIVPTLVSILISPDKNGLLYTKLKKQFALSIGCRLEVLELGSNVSKEELFQKIDKLNSRKEVDGIMIQLPLPKSFSISDREEVVNKIAKDKDIDGLRYNSSFVSPVVKSVLLVLREASFNIVRPPRVVVIGSEGFEGKKIFEALFEMGYEVRGVDKENEDKLKGFLKEANIVISATGCKDVIKSEDVMPGSVLIDVGYPFGDIEKKAYKKASFVSPVPGGIGPVTISFLMENLIEAARFRL